MIQPNNAEKQTKTEPIEELPKTIKIETIEE